MLAATLVIGGTAIPQRFYTSVACHLATHGVATLTFDFRSVGGSRRECLRDEPATLLDWAQLDAAGLRGTR